MKRRTNVHHRQCKSRGGRGGMNCVEVDIEKHRLWHALFSNKTGPEVARELNALWLDSRYEVIITKKEPKNEDQVCVVPERTVGQPDPVRSSPRNVPRVLYSAQPRGRLVYRV